MSKYIIELGEDAKAIQSISITSLGNVYVDSWYVENLEELNSDYINEHYGSLQDEAYKRGINDGSLDVKQRVEGAYQRGLDDAWEAARKIAEMWETIDNDELLEIFGLTAKIGESTIGTLFKKQTASEAIAKLKAYEEKQKQNKIGVGDVVKTYNGITFVVTKATIDGIVVGFEGEGNTCRFALGEVTKTGEHYNISEILGGLSDD